MIGLIEASVLLVLLLIIFIIAILRSPGIAMEMNVFNFVFGMMLLTVYYIGNLAITKGQMYLVVVVILIGLSMGFRTPEGAACDKELIDFRDETDPSLDLLADPHGME